MLWLSVAFYREFFRFAWRYSSASIFLLTTLTAALPTCSGSSPSRALCAFSVVCLSFFSPKISVCGEHGLFCCGCLSFFLFLQFLRLTMFQRNHFSAGENNTHDLLWPCCGPSPSRKQSACCEYMLSKPTHISDTTPLWDVAPHTHSSRFGILKYCLPHSCMPLFSRIFSLSLSPFFFLLSDRLIFHRRVAFPGTALEHGLSVRVESQGS